MVALLPNLSYIRAICIWAPQTWNCFPVWQYKAVWYNGNIYVFPKKWKPSFRAWEIFRVLRKGPLSLQALALIPLYKREPSIIYFMGSKSLRILVENTFTYKGERVIKIKRLCNKLCSVLLCNFHFTTFS